MVAVVQDGRVVYQRAFGVKESGRSAPMTLDTQLMIGSTGKSLTTLMMATLVDDGLMAWDTPVVDILPSFRVADPELSRTLTMQNLVCACSGVPRRDYEFILNAHTLGAEDVVRSLADFQFFTDFGETFQYSNQMVATAGYVAGVAAGGRADAMLPGYAAALQARVLTPIGMRATTISSRQVEARGDYATPHGQTLSGARLPIALSEEALLTPVTPAGATWSTAPDMARYLLTLLAGGVAPDGRRIVSTAALAHLWTPQVKVSADTSYGLGWMITDTKGLRKIEHAGNTFGFTSGLAFLPDKGLGVVVLTNARASNVFNEAVIRRVIDLAFGQDTAAGAADFHFALKRTADALASAAEHESTRVDPAAVSAHLGAYRNAALGDLTLSFLDGRFVADVGEFQTDLWRYTADDGSVRYLAADPPLAGLPLSLTEDADGAPTVTLTQPARPLRVRTGPPDRLVSCRPRSGCHGVTLRGAVTQAAASAPSAWRAAFSACAHHASWSSMASAPAARCGIAASSLSPRRSAMKSAPAMCTAVRIGAIWSSTWMPRRCSTARAAPTPP